MGEKAMELFKEMSSGNSVMEQNKSTFISPLSACSHSGFINEGKLKEAYEFITGIGEPQKAGVWGALLSACNYHGDTKLGKEFAKVLFEMEPDNASYYISLANTYVGLELYGYGRWWRIIH
ncbi:unnamed protein product [Arabidopsis halleri]